VPGLDDERFERYLKQFHPVAPAPLPAGRPERANRRQLLWVVSFAAAAEILAVALLVFQRHTAPPPLRAPTLAVQRASQQPLTIGRANALLTQAPSFKAAVDSIAFRSQAAPISKGRQSALTALSKERIKL
jgi:hypothetical protein